MNITRHNGRLTPDVEFDFTDHRDEPPGPSDTGILRLGLIASLIVLAILIYTNYRQHQRMERCGCSSTSSQ